MTLKDLRKQAGLTQLELGCKVGVTSSAIVQYEKYKRVPDIFVIVKLSKALEVPIMSRILCTCSWTVCVILLIVWRE